MQHTGVLLTGEIKSDQYEPGHPWSVSVHERSWRDSVVIEQGGHGVRPVYIASGDVHRFIGTDFKEIAESHATLSPDETGRLALLLLGRTLGEWTLVREIRRMPPGDTHIVNGTRITSSWKDLLEDIGTPTVDDVAETFIRGIRKRITYESTGWLPLSG
nr:hypothetical protein [bacterium]